MVVCFFSVHVYSIFNKDSNASIGGTEVQLFLLSKYLSKDSNIDVNVITGDWGQGDFELYENIGVYKSFSIEKKILNYIKGPFLLWSTLKKVNSDIYIASSAGVEIGIISLFCLLNKKKFIYRTAHDMDCSGEYSKKGIIGKIYDFGIRRANLVVTQTKKNQEMLMENYGIRALLMKNAYEISNKKDLNKESYILWVSRCEKWKNPELILKIATSLSQCKFKIICNKQSNQEQLFLKIKSEASRLSNVDFIERVPFLEIQDCYNRASLFIGTSEYEGFPNTYIQACIGSVPIVSYKVNPDNFILDNNLGYCADGDFDLMIKQIKKIISEEDDWKIKSENAYRYIKENHDIEIIGERWKKAIGELF